MNNVRIVLISFLAFLLGWQLGHYDIGVKWARFQSTVSIVNKEPPKEIDLDFKLFWDTWNLVSQEYLDKKAIDPQKLFYGAIQGMTAAVGDPYTVFLPPESQRFSKDDLNGSFEGVGMQLGFNEAKPADSGSKDKKLLVIAPLSGSPAEKAGLKPQDWIIKIDDKDTAGMTLPDAVKLIRGTKGTQVTLVILRENDGTEPKTFTLVRDTIIVKSVEVSYRKTRSGKDVAILKLSRFGERTKDEWHSAVTELLDKNSQAVILDLRNNPGGFLEGAVFVASEFLEGGDVVSQENSKGKRSPYKVNRKGKLINIPLEVLINKGSASASEIVAGALQDRKRGKLIGEKSFGKGTIQEAQDLAGGTGIHITVAKWLTPNNRWVNDTGGLEPDVRVDLPESAKKDQDLQLEKALDLLE